MSNKSSNNDGSCVDNRSIREYSPAQELLNNLPYIVMILLGSAILIVCFVNSALGLIISSVYLIYGLIGALWIIIFLCPYCGYWNTRSCPCGYGRIAARFQEKRMAVPSIKSSKSTYL